MSRFNKLKKALGRGAEYLARPNAAIKAATMDYLEDEDLGGALERGYEQLGQESSTAPTGYEIGEKAGEKYDITNPLALTAVSTAAEMADLPYGLGKLSKASRMARGGSKTASKIDDLPSKLREPTEKPIKRMGEGVRLIDDTPRSTYTGKVRTPDMDKTEDIGEVLTVPEDSGLNYAQLLKLKQALKNRD